MKLLADENIERELIAALQEADFEVISIWENRANQKKFLEDLCNTSCV